MAILLLPHKEIETLHRLYQKAFTVRFCAVELDYNNWLDKKHYLGFSNRPLVQI
jgi:hypothetical protein